MTKVLIVAAIHGNETYGIDLYEHFIKKHPEYLKNISLVIGNKKAYQKNVRFLDHDANRIFSNPPKSAEFNEIEEIKSEIKAFNPDYIIDIHTTLRSSGVFIITNSCSGAKQKLIQAFNKMPVCMLGSMHAKNSLIAFYSNAISLEYSLDSISNITKDDFSDSIISLLNNDLKESNRDIYNVTALITEPELNDLPDKINFKQHKKGATIMVPKDKSEMDAEYFGFWAKYSKKKV